MTETGFKQISSMAMARTHKKSKKVRSSLKINSLAILRSLADPHSDISKIADQEYDPEGIERGTEDIEGSNNCSSNICFRLHFVRNIGLGLGLRCGFKLCSGSGFRFSSRDEVANMYFHVAI